MKHLATTLSGVLGILGAAFTFAGMWISTGAPPPAEMWAILGTALTSGVGLIKAADAKPKDAA